MQNSWKPIDTQRKIYLLSFEMRLEADFWVNIPVDLFLYPNGFEVEAVELNTNKTSASKTTVKLLSS